MTPARIALSLALLLPLPALGVDEGPEWEAVADVETIQVLTEKEDGTRRDTTVWLVVVDGQGYIRTGGSSWGDAVKADPDVEIRIGDASYLLQVRFVEDEELYQRVTDAFREKYGFADVLAGVLRGSNPSIMRLTSR